MLHSTVMRLQGAHRKCSIRVSYDRCCHCHPGSGSCKVLEARVLLPWPAGRMQARGLSRVKVSPRTQPHWVSTSSSGTGPLRASVSPPLMTSGNAVSELRAPGAACALRKHEFSALPHSVQPPGPHWQRTYVQEIGFIIPTLQMGKQRLREVK